MIMMSTLCIALVTFSTITVTQYKLSRTSVNNIDVATTTSLAGGRVTFKYDFCLVWQYCLAFRMLVTLETR